MHAAARRDRLDPLLNDLFWRTTMADGQTNNNNYYPSGFSRRDLVTPEEVALLFNVKRKCVIDWARTGYLPGMKLRRSWRFLRTDINEFLLGLRATA
jgi:excisionase family DNA binding protein